MLRRSTILVWGLGVFCLVAHGCKERTGNSASALEGLSESCDQFVPVTLSDQPGKVGWGTRLLKESLDNPEAFKRFFVISLGVFMREEFGNYADLERFGQKVTIAHGHPAVSHWQFYAAGLARKGQLPTGIIRGSAIDLEYEKRFSPVLEQAIERYFCNKQPVIFFNLTGVERAVKDTLTSRELKLILAEPRYLERTQFYAEDEPMTEKQVRRRYAF